MNKWNPDKSDVIAVCLEITENFYQDGRDWPDSCKHCMTEYVFMRNRTDKQIEKLSHDTDCLVLKARDILTGV